MAWRQAVGFPGHEVSEHGDVRRIDGTRLRGFVDMDGYLRFHLMGGDGQKRLISAHKLVAEAFIGPAPTDKHEVAHNNGSRVCNHWTNLRWATREENHHDMRVHGTSLKGERNGRAKLNAGDVVAIRREYRAIKHKQSSLSLVDLEARYGIHRATLCNIARGRAWSHIPMERAS